MSLSAKIRIYTDGSCSPNPGPGGWAAILLFDATEKVVELQGAEEAATNNRMELTAAIRGLAALDNGSRVELYTDSRYLQKGITQWLGGWQRNGWSTLDGAEVKNRDLWERLSSVLAKHQVRWIWVKGHSSDEWNTRADELAAAARRAITRHSHNPADGVALYPGVTWKNSSGSGAWAVVLNYRDHVKILGGFASETTANRLYLVAVIEGIQALKRSLPVHLYTKSGYLRDGLGTWLDGWRKRGWQTREGNEISNKEQWQQLYDLSRRFSIEVIPALGDDLPCHMQEAKELAREFEHLE